MLFMFVMLSPLFIAAVWSPAGKGLTSWPLFGMFNCVFVTFPCGILGQMWYLNALIPDLCRLSYFTCIRKSIRLQGPSNAFLKSVGIASAVTGQHSYCIHISLLEDSHFMQHYYTYMT